jgi:hypothetical protein
MGHCVDDVWVLKSCGGQHITRVWILRRFGEPSRDKTMGINSCQIPPLESTCPLRQYYASEETLYFLLVLANIGIILFSLSTMIIWVY